MNSYETIRQTLEEIMGTEVSFSLGVPDDVTHGDYATNIAFPLSKTQNISPKECALDLKPQLEKKLSNIITKIEIAGPGFINFFLKDEIIRKENEGREIKTKFAGKNVLVEHSSPNLFKPFSVGHLMNNIIGEFVARAVNDGGANIKTMSFPSDISLGIAKALFIIERDLKEGKINLEYFKTTNENEIIKYLGEAYVKGFKECEENEDNLIEVKKVLENLYNHINKQGLTGYERFRAIIITTRDINESYFKKVLNSLGSTINDFIYESSAGIFGEEIVRANIGKVFTDSEGAIVYIPDEERKDINTSVFINSQGFPTYDAKDLGLIKIKFEQLPNFKPDISLFITDAEQTQHFKVVFDAANKLGDEWKSRIEKSKHIPHGRMLFKGQKMSSRLGGVPLALDVIATVEEEVRERAGDKIAHLSVEDKKGLEREIALSALRISVLRSKPGININFDPESSLSFEGDSGPYLLYTHARCSSLLEKGGGTPAWSDYEVTPLEKVLIHFEKVLENTIEELAPQVLVTYLFKVAQAFNTYYGGNQIIVEGDTKGNAHRLMIVKRTKEVLNKSLHVLGIKAPERM